MEKPTLKKSIALIGFMASGKTTVGLALGKRMGITCYDSDTQIEKTENKLISDIFEQLGETHFRELEFIAMKEISTHFSPHILSTGGGLPCFGDNLIYLKKHYSVIYLKQDFEILFGRIKSKEEKRPLAILDKLAMLNLFLEREKTYLQADLLVDSKGKTNSQICTEILQFVTEKH